MNNIYWINKILQCTESVALIDTLLVFELVGLRVHKLIVSLYYRLLIVPKNVFSGLCEARLSHIVAELMGKRRRERRLVV